jgi:hypothetical protein
LGALTQGCTPSSFTLGYNHIIPTGFQFASLQHDPNRPEDVLKVDADEDGNGGDDAADCMRYLVATKRRVVAQRKLRGL